MDAGDDHGRSQTSRSRGERFELERFEWKAPDRLEVAGKFHGLDEAQFDEPVLVVSGDGGAHRLRAASELDAHPSENGDSWRAQFVWDETPVGVESATLELGPDIAVDLPAPGAKRTLLRPRFLDIRRTDAGADEPQEEPPAPGAGADVTLQAELVAAEQQVVEVRAALDRAEAELARARADLEAERSGRAADAERFRDGLARVRASAEQALADAQSQAQDLEEHLTAARAAQTEADAAVTELRGQLEAAEAARTEAENERDGLREQIAAGEELKRRVTALEQIGDEAGEMRADAQRLLERLTRLVDVLDAGK